MICLYVFSSLLTSYVLSLNCPPEGKDWFNTQWIAYKSRPCDAKSPRDNCEGYMVFWNESFRDANKDEMRYDPQCMQTIKIYYGGQGACCDGWESQEQTPMQSKAAKPFIIKGICQQRRRVKLSWRWSYWICCRTKRIKFYYSARWTLCLLSDRKITI